MATTKINTPELFDFSATNTALQLPTGTTAQRPTSPSAGEWRYNTDQNKVEYYDGSDWRQIDDEALPLPANFPGLNFNTNTYVGNGATQVIDAKFNEAAVFNGSSSYIQTSLSPSYSSISHSVWFYADSADSTNALYYFDNRGGRIDVNISGTGSNSVSANAETVNITATTATSQWNNLLLVYTGWASSYSAGSYGSAITVTAYLNGSSIGTASPTPYGQTTGMRIGRSGGTYYFEGKIDQVRIFNTALTQQQVTDLYNDETTTTAGVLNFPTGAGCIAAYQLDGDASDVGGTYGGIPTDLGFVGLQFQPDLVWIKSRTQSNSNHVIYDSIRTAGKYILPNTTGAEGTISNGLTAFDTNGFTLGNEVGHNNSGSDYVAWSWKAGGTAVTNNDGATSAQVSANPEAGFSVISYNPGATADTTVGHGLGVQPKLYIAKNLDASEYWIVGSTLLANNRALKLNELGATFVTSGWSNDYPTSEVISVNINANADYILYAFADVDNYQKIGSYNGDNSTDRLINTGFQPRFVMIKKTNGTSNWQTFDSLRGGDAQLYFNSSGSEYTGGGTVVTFETNGFKIKTNYTTYNATGGEYIYWAIA